MARHLDYAGRIRTGIRLDNCVMKTKLTLLAVLAAALFWGGCASTEPAFVSDGLVAYYPFNGDAKDVTTNNYHGLIEGPTPSANRFGQLSRAITFDGADDRVSLPHKLFHGLEALTFSTWLNLDSAKEKQTILSLANKSSDNAGLIDFEEGTFRISRQHCGPRTLPSVSVDSFVHRWRQIVVTKGPSSEPFKVYVDGVLKSNLTFQENGALVVDPGGAWLGQDQDAVGGEFDSKQALKGSIDDVRIYNRALSADEVKALYDLEKPKGK